MATVLRRDEKPKAVKNLGWLLRHWSQVEWIGFNYSPDSKRLIDGQLVAKLRDGTTYLTDYASLSVCWNWLDRPIFQGVEFRLWNMATDAHVNWLIGSTRWKEINRMPYAEFISLIQEAR